MASMQITASSRNGKMGHAALVSFGDDGKVHITAYRRRGEKIVEVGQYSIVGADLLKIAEHATWYGRESERKSK